MTYSSFKNLVVKKGEWANRDFRGLDQARKKGQKPGDDVHEKIF